MDYQVLEKVGLTKNESVTYLTLLRIGTSRTGKLLQESGLNSGKIYEILQGLKIKGLVSETLKDKVREFTAAPPKQILQYLEQKKKSIQEDEKHIVNFLPELNRLREQTIQEKRIVTYTGFRGIVTASEEALEKTPQKSEILSLGISDTNAWSQKYWVKWEKLRQRKNIKARYIVSQRGEIFKYLLKEKKTSVKIMELNTLVGIDVYGKDKVLILHYQEPISATLIVDAHTAMTFQAYFEPLWSVAIDP